MVFQSAFDTVVIIQFQKLFRFFQIFSNLRTGWIGAITFEYTLQISNESASIAYLGMEEGKSWYGKGFASMVLFKENSVRHEKKCTNQFWCNHRK